MVNQILQENDLCTYYDIDENAAFSLKGKKQERYDYLDDTEIIEKIIDFQDEKMTKVSFLLPQIHCASCIWLLENLYKLNTDVHSSKVNFLKKEIYITFANSTSLRKIVELLASIGYAPAINLGTPDEERSNTLEKSFYYKIGLAGFAFGNVMLMSFPEYLGLTDTDGAHFQTIFGYVNIFISTLVLLYSGKDYLISAWNGIKHGDFNIDVPISLGIVSIWARSVYEILSHTGAGYLDSFTGLIFFLLIGKWFQQKTYYQLSFERDYKSYFPISAALLKDGKEKPVPLKNLEKGDIVLVRNSELIPADGLLLKGEAYIDYSFVTGEAQPIKKQVGDKIFAGGRQMGEAIQVNITKNVGQSYLIQLWNNDAFQQKEQGDISGLADKIGKYFTYAILLIATATLVYWMPKDSSIAINAFTAVLIIACPCAVALSIPFTFGNVLRILAKHQFYLKNTNIIELLHRSSAIVFDKTGTLTQAMGNSIVYEGEALTNDEIDIVFALSQQSGHPLSRQITDFLLPQVNEKLRLSQFEEILGKGTTATISNNTVRLGSSTFILGKQEGKQKNVLIEINGVYKGHFIIKNQYRSDFKRVLQQLQQLFSAYLLSGDNDREKDFLTPLFGDENKLHFNQSPENKLNFIQSLQQNNNTVIMLGDGLNDAGALQQSDVGIVISENINNFTPASDAIISADQFEQLPQLIHYTQRSVRLVYMAYALALIYNIVGLSFAVQGELSPIIAAILMPASSITIAVFGVLSSNILAQRIL